MWHRAQMDACMVGWKSCIHSHQSTISNPNRNHHWHKWRDLAYTFQIFACSFKAEKNPHEFMRTSLRLLSSCDCLKCCCGVLVEAYMYMPNQDAEKVTMKGSHGNNSWQRESDSFVVKRTVSWQGSAVQSAPQGPTQNTWTPEGFTHKNQTSQIYTHLNTENNVIQTRLNQGGNYGSRGGDAAERHRVASHSQNTVNVKRSR